MFLFLSFLFDLAKSDTAATGSEDDFPVLSLYGYCFYILTLGIANCHDIKTEIGAAIDGMYWLDPDAGDSSNAFLAYCDMTSYNGGWTMCYTTDEYAKPKSEVTYNPDFPYGVDGYRTNCNNIPVS